MNKTLSQQFRRNIVVLSIIITVIFFMINIALYIINNNYLINKVEEENKAFIQITAHLINENDISVAVEYIEHYIHIHEVDVELVDGFDQMIFSSDIAHRYASRYNIETSKGQFTLFVDNTDSITVQRIEMNTIYVNSWLLVIYFIGMIILVVMNRRTTTQIKNDVNGIMSLMRNDVNPPENIQHREFITVYNTIKKYIEDIDVLTEQKEINIKGLAHDIKTPLTMVYSYFNKVNKGVKTTSEERNVAYESSKKINHLLNEIIDNQKRSNKKIDISQIITAKLQEYQSVFDNKKITIVKEYQTPIYITWNEKDFSRVIDNIITNAYYYSKPGSTFSVIITEGKEISITFKSSPLHFESVDVRQMFTRGYRDKSSLKLYEYGKGLGLYLCRILLRNVNGNIEATKNERNVEIIITL